MLSFDNIPIELREMHQWVVRDERKIPIDPKTGVPASSTDPTTWDSYENAIRAYRTGRYAGIGFVFTESDPYVGVDYDHVRENGGWEAGYLEEILSFGSYAELSPSGTGAHVITKGKIPGDRHRSGPREMYERGRYFTFTGNQIEGACSEIRQAQEAINTVYQIIDPNHQENCNQPSQPERPAHDVQQGKTTSDYEIIRKAEAAKNGDKFSRLMRGDWSGYPSQSEADSALCCMLVFYTRDIPQIYRIFRMSGLDRPKWMEKHGALTYGELTIQHALSTVKEQSSRSMVKNFRQPVTTHPEAYHFSTTLGIGGGILSLDITQKEEMDGFITQLRRGEEILSTLQTEREPWISKKNAGELASNTKSEEYKVKVLNDAILEIFEDIKASPDVQAITSNAVMKVISATKEVQWERTIPPRMVIFLADEGREGTICLTPGDLAQKSPLKLNSEWISTIWSDLNATKKDFSKIIEYWHSVKDVVDPIGNVSQWDTAIDELQTEISALEVETDKSAIRKGRLYLQEDGKDSDGRSRPVLWVNNKIVIDVMKNASKSENDPTFSNYLRAKGILITKSTVFRVGESDTPRAWGFNPDFRQAEENENEPKESGCL